MPCAFCRQHSSRRLNNRLERTQNIFSCVDAAAHLRLMFGASPVKEKDITDVVIVCVVIRGLLKEEAAPQIGIEGMHFGLRFVIAVVVAFFSPSTQGNVLFDTCVVEEGEGAPGPVAPTVQKKVTLTRSVEAVAKHANEQQWNFGNGKCCAWACATRGRHFFDALKLSASSRQQPCSP